MNNLRDQKLKTALIEANLQYTGKFGAIAATGAIVIHAENLTNDDDLKQSFMQLNGFLSPYKLSASHYFAGSMLFSLINETELYFTDVIKAILIAYPKNLGQHSSNFLRLWINRKTKSYLWPRKNTSIT